MVIIDFVEETCRSHQASLQLSVILILVIIWQLAPISLWFLFEQELMSSVRCQINICFRAVVNRFHLTARINLIIIG